MRYRFIDLQINLRNNNIKLGARFVIILKLPHRKEINRNDLFLPTDVFLGPVCPYVLAPVARYSNIWKIPILTTSGLGETFRDKNAYPIISLSGTYEKFAKFAEKLLEKYNW